MMATTGGWWASTQEDEDHQDGGVDRPKANAE
jgi:hypothetical protein